ncbi:MAG: hypothetical protein IAE78_07195 [Myxococcus sp.]|nr:hypothetical protein [Myxococcus sp.]
MRAALLVLFSVVLAGCAGVGTVLVDDEAPVVTIVGGMAATGTGTSWRVFYFVDRRTRLCALEIGEIGGVVSCCDVWRLREARPHLRWLSAEKCADKPVAADQK